MFRFIAALLAAQLLCIITYATAQAHVVCGNRVFPTTLTMDDPGVSDELSLPTINLTPTPSGESNSYGYEWDKTITEDLGFGINGNYVSQRGAQNLNGWNNISVTLKDQHPCIDRHPHEELVWSVGLIRLIPGTGAAQLRNAGAIASTGSTAPTFYFGKGLGDVAAPYLRPFAITGELSRVISDSPAVSPSGWSYAVSLQYSLPYLKQNITALPVSRFITGMTPLVEFAVNAPDVGPPSATISPGILYDANTWQLGAEAILPADKAAHQAQGTGFIIQFHAFLDAYYKNWFGKPIINRNLWK
ncbi:MAG: hypothetical protein JO030_00040 [Candidatus Eremiobacteraeota bacterium]|nr:hypothetical protein [Candidatus Eremiobacteraeota bacterium]